MKRRGRERDNERKDRKEEKDKRERGSLNKVS
jgi:hypothetical protein